MGALVASCFRPTPTELRRQEGGGREGVEGGGGEGGGWEGVEGGGSEVQAGCIKRSLLLQQRLRRTAGVRSRRQEAVVLKHLHTDRQVRETDRLVGERLVRETDRPVRETGRLERQTDRLEREAGQRDRQVG